MTPHFVGPPDAPGLISDLEPEIRRIVDGLLDRMRGKTRIDAVDEFAYPLPVTVICKVLGVPLEDEPRFHRWIETALDAWEYGPETASEEFRARLAGGNQAVQEFGRFTAELYDRYARQPGPGMLSAMVNEDGPEGRMPKGLLTSNALLLIFAGHETTVNLIAHSVLTLLRHPDALEKLRHRPELIVSGVEELLRFESSVQFWPTRSAVEDIDIAGTTIPKGAPIFLAYGSANRDPRQFTDPDELDLERRDNQHLGFGQGIHFCFGAPLARLEVQNAVGEFVRRVENPGSSRTRRRTGATRSSADRGTSWSTSTASATDPAGTGGGGSAPGHVAVLAGGAVARGVHRLDDAPGHVAVRLRGGVRVRQDGRRCPRADEHPRKNDQAGRRRGVRRLRRPRAAHLGIPSRWSITAARCGMNGTVGTPPFPSVFHRFRDPDRPRNRHDIEETTHSTSFVQRFFSMNHGWGGTWNSECSDRSRYGGTAAGSRCPGRSCTPCSRRSSWPVKR